MLKDKGHTKLRSTNRPISSRLLLKATGMPRLFGEQAVLSPMLGLALGPQQNLGGVLA